MANSYIRMYDKPVEQEEPATWLGLSASSAHDFMKSQERVAAFFTEHGFSIAEVDLSDRKARQIVASIGGTGSAYYEVKPPIPEEKCKEIGAFFATLVDRWDATTTTLFMDNRAHPYPTTYSSAPSKLLASWG